MKRVVAIVGPVVLILAVAGCGASQKQGGAAPSTSSRTSSRSILYAGDSTGLGPRRVVSDAAARHDVKLDVRDWRAWLATYKGSGTPAELSRRQFRLRLAAVATLYHFAVKRVQFIHARVLAPFVIVQTRHYLALARAIPAFWKSLDPAPPRPCARRLGKTTACAPAEVVFFEAQDERDVPFIALGLGQWARSEPLYPYIHG